MPTIDELSHKISIHPPGSGEPAALAFLVTAGDGKTYHAYEYPHPAVAATVAVFDRRKEAYLVVKRENEPFRNHFAFPGGFLDVGQETTEETAARELQEETGIDVAPGSLTLVDVRSAPTRDPRDHVLDIAYYVEVEDAAAEARDETLAVRWCTAEELDALPLAFDHDELWRRVRLLRDRSG